MLAGHENELIKLRSVSYRLSVFLDLFFPHSFIMEQLKRSRMTITDENDNNKRRKTHSKHDSIFLVKTNERISVFKDLSNELIYQIFDYLYFHNAFESFSDLNGRF